jgi:beta-lactam-binding protein with PASTA domain
MCFAQSPQPDEPLEKNRVILYVSSGNNKPIIWPDFIGQSIETVTTLLDMHSIKPYIIDDTIHSHTNKERIVIDQRPLAGTLLTLDEKKPLSVQLRIY